MTARETIALVHDPIQSYSRRWMLAPSTDAYGVELGFATGAQFWVVGRAGVLGGCPVEVAAAAIAFEPIDKVREAWTGLPEGMTHHEVADRYCTLVTDWGGRTLHGYAPELLDTVDALGRRIVDSAPASIGPIFAGWRTLRQPTVPGERASLTMHLLRELRGAAHIVAIAACGLTPLDAILSAPHAPPRTGPTYAERMGYKGPFRNPEEITALRVQAEQLTVDTIEPYYACLDAEELAIFSSAVRKVCA